ncbi:hypothetical protein [Maribacter sp. 2210JD10-5]|uniref:hypothetical protein n=1 Tax=Maribacter sp. 2210JD10-5 TaxID=3386272 RepID=UPI0039BD782C
MKYLLLLEGGTLDLGGIIIMIFLIMLGPPLLFLIIGIILIIKKKKKAGKIFCIIAGIYLLICLGICGVL